jgi:solute carrier family 35 protein F1/2
MDSNNQTRRTYQPTPAYTFLGMIPLQAPAWIYFFVTLWDVEANYVTVLAFKFTTLTSVNLFDALAIPSAMVLSRIFLKRSYVPIHVIGAVICMSGIVVNVFTDYQVDKHNKEATDDLVAVEQEREYPHRLWGDILAIYGGLIWGANNVIQEYAIRNSGQPLEFLGVIGFFGTFISIVQIALLERDDFSTLFATGDVSHTTCVTTSEVLLILGYILCVALMYILSAYFLLFSESALYNLSLLSSDLWTVIFSVVAEHIVPPPLFFLALLLIVSGVVLYETGPSPIVQRVEEKTSVQNGAQSSTLYKLSPGLDPSFDEVEMPVFKTYVS